MKENGPARLIKFEEAVGRSAGEQVKSGGPYEGYVSIGNCKKAQVSNAIKKELIKIGNQMSNIDEFLDNIHPLFSTKEGGLLKEPSRLIL